MWPEREYRTLSRELYAARQLAFGILGLEQKANPEIVKPYIFLVPPPDKISNYAPDEKNQEARKKINK